jgi:hypothetical protein
MRLTALLFLAGFAACAPSAAQNTATDPEIVRSQIDSLDARFNRWANAGHADSIASHYFAPEAVVLIAGSPPIRGRDAIRDWFAGFDKIGIMRGHIQLSSIVVADSVATDIGQYTVEFRDRADTTKVVMSDRGNYATSFVRRDGEWRAIYDVSVSDVPVPTPTAPAPKSDARQ